MKSNLELHCSLWKGGNPLQQHQNFTNIKFFLLLVAKNVDANDIYQGRKRPKHRLFFTPVYFNLKTSLTATKTKVFVLFLNLFELSLWYLISWKQDGGCHVPDITPVYFKLKTSPIATKAKGFLLLFFFFISLSCPCVIFEELKTRWRVPRALRYSFLILKLILLGQS
jgi:hypothetical protein